MYHSSLLRFPGFSVLFLLLQDLRAKRQPSVLLLLFLFVVLVYDLRRLSVTCVMSLIFPHL
nr:MAG TPA: hypothetical protein [Bacteriophage sp.]